MMIFGFLFLVLCVVVVVWFLRGSQRTGPYLFAPPGGSKGLDVLEERYARGEIEREEYLQKRSDLAGRPVKE